MNKKWERDNLHAKVYTLRATLDDVLAELDTFADDEPTRHRLNTLIEHAFSASGAATSFASFLRRERAAKCSADMKLLAELERIARAAGGIDVRA